MNRKSRKQRVENVVSILISSSSIIITQDIVKE